MSAGEHLITRESRAEPAGSARLSCAPDGAGGIYGFPLPRRIIRQRVVRLMPRRRAVRA